MLYKFLGLPKSIEKQLTLSLHCQWRILGHFANIKDNMLNMQIYRIMSILVKILLCSIWSKKLLVNKKEL